MLTKPRHLDILSVIGIRLTVIRSRTVSASAVLGYERPSWAQMALNDVLDISELIDHARLSKIFKGIVRDFWPSFPAAPIAHPLQEQRVLNE